MRYALPLDGLFLGLLLEDWRIIEYWRIGGFGGLLDEIFFGYFSVYFFSFRRKATRSRFHSLPDVEFQECIRKDSTVGKSPKLRNASVAEYEYFCVSKTR